MATTKVATRALLAVALLSARREDVVPPPLGDTPSAPNASSPILEIVRTFPLPNPEEVAVDPTGSFFVTGTDDGYVSAVNLVSGISRTIFSPRDFRPGFFADATDDEIREVCNGSDVAKERNCGRVLGVEFEVDASGECKSLWLANSYFGIYRGSCREPWTLERRVSIKGQFLGDIQPMGKYLYYTVAHGAKQRYQLPYVFLDAEAPAGSLHRLDMTNDYNSFNTELLREGLYFPNGLAASPDGRFLYVAETTAARVLRYDIAAETLDPFLEDLPVLPSGLRVDALGDLLVPGYTRNEAMETLLTDPAALADFLAQGPEAVETAFRAMVAPHGNLVVYEEEEATNGGSPKERIFSDPAAPAGEGFASASSAHALADPASGEPDWWDRPSPGPPPGSGSSRPRSPPRCPPPPRRLRRPTPRP